ncbi:MAG: hypothetical protein ACI4AH_03315 [Muribaculaceae bacterium]
MENTNVCDFGRIAIRPYMPRQRHYTPHQRPCAITRHIITSSLGWAY